MAMPGTKRKPSLRKVASQVLVTVKWKGLVGQVKGSSVGGGATSLKYDKSKDLSAMVEKRWYLSKLLENYPSHFNKRIEEDPSRLSFVYNEIVFRMDTLPEQFQPALVNLIGFIESARGNGERAARCFTNVSKMDETNLLCLVNKAYIALKANQYKIVQDTIQQLNSNLSPNQLGQVAAEIGHFYQWFGLNCAAKKEYERALEYDEKNPIAIFGMAVVLYELSKHEGRMSSFRYLNRSLEHFRRLSRLIPNFTLVKIYEGKVRNQLIALVTPESSSDNEADRIFTQVMDTDCEPEILCMIGEEYLRLGMLDGEPSAISIFQRALTKRKNSKVYHMLGLALRAKFFRMNEEMHELFKQGLFTKSLTDRCSPVEEKEQPKEKKDKTKEKKEKKPKEPPADPEQVNDLKEHTGDDDEGVGMASIEVTLDLVIETMSTAVKLSRGANREAVFDLAESLWLAGERNKAVTNFELATRSENVLIQVKAHQRLAHAFLDCNDLPQAEYHLKYILKMETGCEEGSSSRAHFLDLITEMANRYILKKDMKKSEEWVKINIKNQSEDAPMLRQKMVYTKFK